MPARARATPATSPRNKRRAAAPAFDAAAVRDTLRRRFKLRRLRPGQERVIERVLRRLPTLAVMPTGAGKSLCYQLPALLFEGRTLVVSPLIALMKDQCESLQALGIAAVQVNSALDSDEARAAEAAVADGSARIVMTTPERLADPAFVEMLSAHPVSLLAVDEAHCISQWGHDFRPAFLEVGHALARLGDPVVLALTATATEEVVRDICEQLRIPAAGVVNTSSYRPNLDLRVEAVANDRDKLARAVEIVRAAEGCGLVYAATIKAAEEMHAALRAADIDAGLYHGRLPAAERHAQQEAFMDGTRRVMVATNAFGLGIDKPDIRFVLHYQLPPRLEAYYQEAGRAGRDGEHAECTLIFLRGDKAIQQFFLAGRYPTVEDAIGICHALEEPTPDAQGWTVPLLQARLGRPRSKLQVAVGVLRREGLVAQDDAGTLRLARQGVPANEIADVMDAYGDKRGQDREALEQMVHYAQAGQCRWRLLLERLDDDTSLERCGHCDNCRRISAHEKVLDHLQRQPQEDAERDRAAPSEDVLKRGDIVVVRRYGRGIVEDATAVEVAVKFADGAQRAFLPQFVARAPRARGTARKGSRTMQADQEPAARP